MIAEESQEGQGHRRVVAPLTRLVTLVPKPTGQPHGAGNVELAAFKVRVDSFPGLGTGGWSLPRRRSRLQPRLLFHSAPNEVDWRALRGHC